MPARLLLEIAIRVLGFWFAFTAITNLELLIYLFMPGFSNPSLNLWQVLIGTVHSVGVRGGLGVMLIWIAPWTAARFYPASIEEPQIHLKIGPGDVYRVACFVLGVYLLIHAPQPAFRLIVSLFRGVPLGWQRAERLVDGITAAVYTGAGIFLVFGSQWIGQWFSNLRYDPDTIPKQQFSLAILMALVLAFAVTLGIIRWLLYGGV